MQGSKNSSNIITWGIIGAGDVCEKKSAPAMYKLPGSTVKSVMRRNKDKAADFASRHKIPHYFDNAGEIFNDPEIDIVYIATPPSSHMELSLQAARGGKPVYVEKPMATSYEECLRMNEIFIKAGLPLFVAYYRRALPNFLKVKELVESGAIGEIRSVNIVLHKTPEPHDFNKDRDNWRVVPDIAGGGYFYDLASHQFDFLDYIFGPIEKAAGFSSNQAGLYEAEDAVTGSFIFENGITGTGSWCFTTGKSSETDRTTIVGSRGYLEYPSFDAPTVELVTDDKGKEIFDFEMPEHIQENLVKTVIDELLGKGTCPSTGKSAARTNKVLELIAS